MFLSFSTERGRNWGKGKKTESEKGRTMSKWTLLLWLDPASSPPLPPPYFPTQGTAWGPSSSPLAPNPALTTKEAQSGENTRKGNTCSPIFFPFSLLLLSTRSFFSLLLREVEGRGCVPERNDFPGNANQSVSPEKKEGGVRARKKIFFFRGASTK